MRNFFWQIVLFLAGALVSVGVPLLPREGQKLTAGILASLLILVSLAWTAIEVSRFPLGKKVLRYILLALAVLAIVGFSYHLGTRKATDTEKAVELKPEPLPAPPRRINDARPENHASNAPVNTLERFAGSESKPSEEIENDSEEARRSSGEGVHGPQRRELNPSNPAEAEKYDTAEETSTGVSAQAGQVLREKEFDPLEVENLLDQADVLILSGNFRDARSRLDEIIQKYPGTEIAAKAKSIREKLPTSEESNR